MKTSKASVALCALTLVWFGGRTSLHAAAPVPPALVPGKEFTRIPYANIEHPPPPFPWPVELWDGTGKVVEGPYLPVSLPPEELGELLPDALANRRDSGFFDVAYHNSATLMFSVTGRHDLDPFSPHPEIWYENPGGNSGVWAFSNDIRSHGVIDLISLEFGGPEGSSDTDFYSVYSDKDFLDDFAAKVAAIRSKAGATALSSVELASAVGLVPGAGTVNGVALDDVAINRLASLIDLDALMYYRNQSDDSAIDLGPNDSMAFGAFAGDEILFSIAPLSHGGQVVFDGGEIWTYTIGSSQPAQFLNHGGHVWDTTFDVRGTFGVFSENVDALEALPAPAPVPEAGALAASGLLAAMVAMRLLRHRVWPNSERSFERRPEAREDTTPAWTP